MSMYLSLYAHARTDEKDEEISQRFRDRGLQEGIKRRSHPPKTPSLLLPRQQRR